MIIHIVSVSWMFTRKCRTLLSVWEMSWIPHNFLTSLGLLKLIFFCFIMRILFIIWEASNLHERKQTPFYFKNVTLCWCRFAGSFIIRRFFFDFSVKNRYNKCAAFERFWSFLHEEVMLCVWKRDALSKSHVCAR